MLGKADLPSTDICLSGQDHPFMLPSMLPLAHVDSSYSVSSFSSFTG